MDSRWQRYLAAYPNAAHPEDDKRPVVRPLLIYGRPLRLMTIYIVIYTYLFVFILMYFC